MHTYIDYSRYMRRAMLLMVSEILSETAEHGLKGDHHFYISFRTNAQGVDVPTHLRASYPDEMTIVLQEWFQDLAVMDDDRFAVTLSFHGKAESLVIPFAALTGFSDPSVQFNLRFDEIEEEEAGDYSEEIDQGAGKSGKQKKTKKQGKVIQLDEFRK